MKRFKWKLQRVLDITVRQERALRAELFLLTHAIVAAREAIVERRTALRVLLEELAARRLGDRMPEQALFMEFSAVAEREIDRLRVRLGELEAEHADRKSAFLRARAMCKALKRLRENARQAYLREVGKREQAELDETAHLAGARRPSPRAARVAS